VSLIRSPSFKITSIYSCVPKEEEKIGAFENSTESGFIKAKKILGIESRRVCPEKNSILEYLTHSAINLIENENVDKSNINVLLVVTQTFEGILPGVSHYLHRNLDLGEETIALDINLGCSGYVYGLWVMSSLLRNFKNGKGLLVVGDTISKFVDKNDSSTSMLFGDAGTATLVEGVDGANSHFVLGSDGKGVESLSVPINSSEPFLTMSGSDVFNFTIKQVPKMLKNLNELKPQVDYYFFHQANKFMIDHLAKKAKLCPQKVPYSLERFGNTSGASIPLTICSAFEEGKPTFGRCMLLGFGVGLSWAGTVIEIDKNFSCNISEI